MLTGCTDCQSHILVCLIMESTSVWSYRAGVNLGDVANYLSELTIPISGKFLISLSTDVPSFIDSNQVINCLKIALKT